MTDGFVEFEVGTVDLRRGLQAVAPHVQPDHQAPDTHRVRVEVNDNGEILLLATDGFSAAVYAASGSNVACVGMDYFDLHPADVVKVLAVFKAGKDDDPDSPDSVLRFKVTEKLCTIRDVSGLFEGHELELPATPPGQWPNVARLFGQALVDLDVALQPTRGTWPMQLSGKMLDRFAKSARAINAPIVLWRGRGPLIVQCSDIFSGVVSPTRISDEQRDKYHNQRLSWSDSMTHLGAVQTARRADADEVDERLEAAIRFTGVRQQCTVKGIRDELGIGKAEADQLLSDMFDRGLIGPAARGKARAALFSPDEVDAVIESVRRGEPWAPEPDEVGTEPFTPSAEQSAAERDDPGEFMPGERDDPADDPGPSESVDEWTADGEPDPADEQSPPASPFSDPVVPPDPFTDSAGNQWPTRDPFIGTPPV